jgi:hypothetical protein
MTIGSKTPAVCHAFPSEWQRLVVETIRQGGEVL